MADGYARVTGKPGVCFIITGPGMTNIATAMGQAYRRFGADAGDLERQCAARSSAWRRAGCTSCPRSASSSPGVAAFSHTLLDPAQLPEVLARAFAVFASARPRPGPYRDPARCHHAPRSDDRAAEGLAVAGAPGARRRSDRARRPQLLRAAKRPLIIAGGGAADAAAGIRTLAERLDAPVFTTINGKGILPPGHPLALAGNLGMAPLREELAAERRRARRSAPNSARRKCIPSRSRSRSRAS